METGNTRKCFHADAQRHLTALPLFFLLLPWVLPAHASLLEGIVPTHADSLRESIWDCRWHGRYREAVDASHRYVEYLSGRPDPRPWELRAAQEMAAMLEMLITLPDAAQRDLAVADSLYAVVRHLCDQNKYAETLDLNERRLALIERRLGEGHLELALCLENEAHCREGAGDYALVEEPLRRALAIRREHHGSEDPLVARDLRQLGNNLAERGRYAEAEVLLTEAANIFERAQEDSLASMLDQLRSQVAVLSAAAAAGTIVRADERLEETRNRLVEVEASWSELQRELAFHHPVTEGLAFPLEHVQATLPENRALIGWVYQGSMNDEAVSWGYVVRSSGPVRWAQVEGA